MDLETVDLDVGLLYAHGTDHQVGDLLTLVTLELDNFTEVWILDNGAVGGEFLLGKFENTFGIDFLGKPLNGG
jgi:hypothetical protein